MRWAFLFLLFLAIPARAAGPKPFPAACKEYFAKIAAAGYNGAKKPVVQLWQDVKAEGPLRLLVRRRTEEEKAASFKSYFVAKPAVEKPPAPRTRVPSKSKILEYGFFLPVERVPKLVSKALQKLRALNPLHGYTPARGVVLSVDRALLGATFDRTATAFFKGGTALAAGLAGSIVATNYLYENPMEWLEATIPLNNAIDYGLDHEYAFQPLRDKIKKGTLSRRAAKAEVAAEFKGRAKYFDLVRASLAEDPKKTMEDVGEDFAPLVNDAGMGSTMKDLRYFLSPQFSQNPSFIWANGKPEPVDMEKFRALFALNHTKLYGSFSLGAWIEPKFKESSLPADSTSRDIYDAIIKDPFRAKLIAYQKSHGTPLPQLEAWLSEDLEWQTRFAELGVLGAAIKGPKEKPLTLEDRRAFFLDREKLPASLL